MPLLCPVAGVFKFQQDGYLPFRTRLIGGITDSPRASIRCLDSISSFKVCDQQKEVHIKANYCISSDTYGRPVDIYSTASPLLTAPSTPFSETVSSVYHVLMEPALLFRSSAGTVATTIHRSIL